MGWVFSISNIGLVIGASFGGWLADTIGSQAGVDRGAVAVFGAFTLVTAMAGNVRDIARRSGSAPDWDSAPPCPT